MFTRVHPVFAAAIVISCLHATTLPASASDPILEWNQIALTTTAVQGAVPQVRSMAIVQTAVHDAVNAITGRYETYSPMGAAPAGASVDAAAIAAAHYTLSRLFTSQAAPLGVLRAASLAAHGLSEADPGIAVGEAAGAAILALRQNDGAAQANFPYVAPGAGMPGVWVAIGTTPPATPGWGRVVPWVLSSGSQFLPDAPPALDSGRYALDVEEVKSLGALNNHTRTIEQTNIANFWRGSPAAIWNSVTTGINAARGLDQSSTARTLALLYLAAADASIVCWNAKYTYNFWRPEAAIKNADVDGNDATVADPSWLPLFPTPPHPEYVSGHASNSGAMAAVLSLIFGDDPGVPITATSPTNPTFPRAWGKFSEGVDEVIEARIYSGIHFRTADDAGAKLGRQVARFVVNHSLRPVR
jgi:hypothetical protein